MSNIPPRTPPKGGGLSIPASLGMSPGEEKAATHRWSTLEHVVDSLNSWGFGDATQPSVECPAITPELLLTPDIQQHTVVFAGQLRWHNYAVTLDARIRGEMLQIKNEMEDIEAETRKRLRKENEGRGRGEKLTELGINDEVQTTPRYRELKIRLQELQQMKYELDARITELEQNLKVVSRQIELRKEEAQSGDREQNMPHAIKRQGPWSPNRR